MFFQDKIRTLESQVSISEDMLAAAVQEHDVMRQELQEAHGTRERKGRQGAALRQLMQIMVRLVKGEVAMRLEVWRSVIKMNVHAKHAELHADLEAQMRAQGQGAGLRQLTQVMARVMKGEVVMRMKIW